MKGGLDVYLNHMVQQELPDTVRGLTPFQVASQTEDEMVQEVMQHMTVLFPILHWEKARWKVEEGEVHIPAEKSEIPGWKVGTKVSHIVPFEGDGKILTLLKIQYPSLQGAIKPDEKVVVLSWVQSQMTEQEVREHFKGRVAELQGYLADLLLDVEAYHEKLPGLVRELVRERRAKIDRDEELRKALGAE